MEMGSASERSSFYHPHSVRLGGRDTARIPRPSHPAPQPPLSTMLPSLHILCPRPWGQPYVTGQADQGTSPDFIPSVWGTLPLPLSSSTFSHLQNGFNNSHLVGLL